MPRQGPPCFARQQGGRTRLPPFASSQNEPEIGPWRNGRRKTGIQGQASAATGMRRRDGPKPHPKPALSGKILGMQGARVALSGFSRNQALCKDCPAKRAPAPRIRPRIPRTRRILPCCPGCRVIPGPNLRPTPIHANPQASPRAVSGSWRPPQEPPRDPAGLPTKAERIF